MLYRLFVSEGRSLAAVVKLLVLTTLASGLLMDVATGIVPPDPIVIGHRGASGYRPEHTLASYALAIEQGADYIEPDLVSTSDGVLVARHENEISGTTDVAERAEFADRFTTKEIDGQSVSGWFTEDFTLAEIKTLRAIERLPDLRPESAAFDGMLEVPTLQEVIDLVHEMGRRGGANGRGGGASGKRKVIGIYPETKHPTYFDGIGLSMEERLVEVLHRNRYRGPQAAVFIQSFEVSNLKDLSTMTRVPLVQLISAGGAPYDFVVAGDPRTYADLVTPAGLEEIATYAAGIGVNKNLIFPRDGDGNIGAPSSLVDEAHDAGLIVHGWTFRAENVFLPTNFQSGSDSQVFGDLDGEVRAFLGVGMDGFFTDQPDIGVAARDGFVDDVD